MATLGSAQHTLRALAAGAAVLLLGACGTLDGGGTVADRPAAASAAPSVTADDADRSAAPSDEAEDTAAAEAEKARAEAERAEAEAAAEAERAAEAEQAEAEAAAAAEAEAEAERAANPPHLERGADGAQVRELQERLVELGYYLPEVDGSFGPATQQAVWALQKAAGIERDGIVGPKTRKALDDGVRPSAQSSSGKVVEIDLSRQLLLAVEDGRVTRIINASSGNGETFEAAGRSYRANTPRGSFAVYMERNYLHESTLELGAMYRPKYFTGAFAVHGSPSIPPWPASHGCVRVSNSAMNWLWDSWGMPQGTPVVLY